MQNDIQLTILKAQDAQLSESIFDHEISKKYSFGLNNLEIKNINGFIKNLEKDFKENISISKFVFNKKGNTVYYITIDTNSENLFLFLNSFKKNKAYVEIFGKEIKQVEKFYDKYINFFLEGTGYNVSLHSYYIDKGLQFDSETITESNIKNISEDYYSDFKSTEAFFEEFLSAKENIVVIAGKPGVGKTKFATLALKYAIKNGDILLSDDEYEEETINVAYVKNERILALDSFWINLKKYEYKFVILDDLDYFLSPRSKVVDSEMEELKNQFISHFLSFTDGLIPTKTKFLITTNRDIDSIDEALLREGRMFAVFSFSLLSREEALKIWEKDGLSKKDFEKEFPNEEEILQSRLGSIIHSYLNNDKKKRASYLKENSNADISKKYLKQKRIGF